MSTIAAALLLVAAQPTGPADLDYDYRYALDVETVQTAEDLTGVIAADFTRYFPFDTDCTALPPVGARCELYSIPGFPLWGTTNPVQVIDRTATSWSFRSLPGHSEGAGRHITFAFERGRDGLWLRVTAGGAWTPTAAATVYTGAARVIWGQFATKVSIYL